MELIHASPVGGHSGIAVTTKKIAEMVLEGNEEGCAAVYSSLHCLSIKQD